MQFRPTFFFGGPMTANNILTLIGYLYIYNRTKSDRDAFQHINLISLDD
jgi:hypothetical protein